MSIVCSVCGQDASGKITYEIKGTEITEYRCRNHLKLSKTVERKRKRTAMGVKNGGNNRIEHL